MLKVLPSLYNSSRTSNACSLPSKTLLRTTGCPPHRLHSISPTKLLSAEFAGLLMRVIAGLRRAPALEVTTRYCGMPLADTSVVFSGSFGTK